MKLAGKLFFCLALMACLIMAIADIDAAQLGTCLGRAWGVPENPEPILWLQLALTFCLLIIAVELAWFFIYRLIYWLIA